MRLEAKKYLYDIQEAASRIAEFTSDKRLKDNRANLNGAIRRGVAETVCGRDKIKRFDAAGADRAQAQRGSKRRAYCKCETGNCSPYARSPRASR